MKSNGARAVLLWSFTASILQIVFLIPERFMKEMSLLVGANSTLLYCMVAGIYCFFPVGGFLADTKFGRFKTVLFGLWLLLPGYIAVIMLITLKELQTAHVFDFDTKEIVFAAFAIFSVILALSLVSFNANIVQLGMDQLYDYPAEDQSLFIHWFMWSHFVAVFLSELAASTRVTSEDFGISDTVSFALKLTYLITVVALFVVVFPLLFVVSVCIAYRQRHWLLIQPARDNPYQLVYLVTKFAWKHKVPLRRSAFTYCEDDIPSGLNLAKHKYGGPFSTEQVEDVKAFYGISRVLFALGPVFFLTFSIEVGLYQFTEQGTEDSVVGGNTTSLEFYNAQPEKLLLINSGLLTPLLCIVAIPLYVFLVRPFFCYYTPRILKRMVLGAVCTTLAIACTLAVGIVAQFKHGNLRCMFNSTPTEVVDNSTSYINNLFNITSDSGPYYDTTIIALPRMLQSFSNLLIYNSVYELICSQSPHSMKGLLVGLVYTVKGLSYLLAASFVFPFSRGYKSTLVSCDISYYAMNLGVGVASVGALLFVVSRYKNRERDELANIYMYAEEYYSKGPPH